MTVAFHFSHVHVWLVFFFGGDAGTRFQAAGYPDEEEDVVAEHEGKANSFGYLNRADSHHCSVCMRRQMLMGSSHALLGPSS